MKILKRIIPIIVTLIFIISFAIGVLSRSAVRALADTALSDSDVSSPVLTDLQKDTQFNSSEFPCVPEDNSLTVIQVAESTDGELLVYVYQPSGSAKNFRATTFNMSIKENAIDYRNYELIFLNASDVFYKYKVADFKVSSQPIRYYYISSIFRAFDEEIDESPGYDNTISEVAYNVGCLWTAETEAEQVKYTMITTETIEVKNKFCGFIRYKGGWHGWVAKYYYTDAHFVAFDTDKDMDKLLEAEVYYSQQGYYWKHYNSWPFPDESGTKGAKKEGLYTSLTADDLAESFDKGKPYFFGIQPIQHYSWSRIMSTKDFKQKMQEDNTILKADGLEALDKTKWVLNFVETEAQKTVTAPDGSYTWDSQLIEDVSVLRLKFVKNGIVYNLGVVDNKQSGSKKPVNNLSEDEFWKAGFIIIAALAVVAVVYGISKKAVKK